jgi:hypothetical protein
MTLRLTYTWEAAGPRNNWSGITDDQKRARRRAAKCLRDGATSASLLEEPTGLAWTARLGSDGRVRWRPAPQGPPA